MYNLLISNKNINFFNLKFESIEKNLKKEITH